MMTTEMTTEMKDYLQMLMPYGTYAVKASDAEIKQFLLLCKQAEKNHSYQLAKYLCWLAKKNNTVLRAAVIEANGMMYLGWAFTTLWVERSARTTSPSARQAKGLQLGSNSSLMRSSLMMIASSFSPLPRDICGNRLKTSSTASR